MLTSPVCCAGMKSKLTAPSGTIRSASTTGIANVATVVDFVVPIERRKRNGPKRSTRREARGRRKSIPAPWASVQTTNKRTSTTTVTMPPPATSVIELRRSARQTKTTKAPCRSANGKNFER